MNVYNEYNKILKEIIKTMEKQITLAFKISIFLSSYIAN